MRIALIAVRETSAGCAPGDSRNTSSGAIRKVLGEELHVVILRVDVVGHERIGGRFDPPVLNATSFARHMGMEADFRGC
ncbi:MAG: hypothetical protein MUF63_18380 [Rhodobacteraceae bacterium]|nr:hypothetical protein [Paracoccaceae bacterium]